MGLLDFFLGRRPAPDPVLGAGRARSPKWPAVRAAHLKAHPTCAACGRRESLEVHHVQPVSVRPDLELDPENLLTLCADPCHLVHGHCMSWSRWCPTVVADVGAYRLRLEAARLRKSA